MRLSERTRAAVVMALAGAAIVILLAAGPAASTGRRPVPVTTTAATSGRTVLAVAMTAWTSNSPMDEAALMRQQARAGAHRAWLARLRAWKAAQARARARRRNEGHVSDPYPGGSVRAMVASIFTRIAAPSQVPMALCVAARASSFNPYARNPHSSAAGVFHW